MLVLTVRLRLPFAPERRIVTAPRENRQPLRGVREFYLTEPAAALIGSGFEALVLQSEEQLVQ